MARPLIVVPINLNSKKRKNVSTGAFLLMFLLPLNCMKSNKQFFALFIMVLFCVINTYGQEKIAQTWNESSCLTDILWTKIPAHPRLFVNSQKWDILKKQLKTDTVTQKLFLLVKERAEIILKSPSLIVENKGVFHGAARQMQGRLAVLAMTYKLTGDKRFLARARQEMTELANAVNWRPDHFLSCAESTVAMSIGLDWLHHDLSPADRKLFADAIIGKALEVSLLKKYNLGNWSESGGNWGAVCNGGMAIGAIAVKEYAPELARNILNRSLANIHLAAEPYAPAGAHAEGPGYWAYGTTFYVLLTDALRSAFGTSCELEKAPGFLRTGEYIIQLMAPSDDMFSFADSEPFWGFEPVMFWFAREHSDMDLAEPLFKRLKPMHEYLVSDDARADASRLLPFSLLWWNPSLVKSSIIKKRALNWWSEGGSLPQAVMRSSWNDKQATFVGIKAGSAGNSHGHMDVGSFVLEANGIRWALDLGRDGYSLPRQYGLGGDLFLATQESKRWSMFCNGSESHNILRFNGTNQWVTGRADITPAKENSVSPGYKIDLSSIYSGQMAKVQRGFHLRADKSVLIQDEWQSGERGAAVTWQWLTAAKVELRNNEIFLTQSGETMRLLFISKEILNLSVQDVLGLQNVWDKPQPGLKRITVRINNLPNSAGGLAVIADPSGKAPLIKSEQLIPLVNW